MGRGEVLPGAAHKLAYSIFKPPGIPVVPSIPSLPWHLPSPPVSGCWAVADCSYCSPAPLISMQITRVTIQLDNPIIQSGGCAAASNNNNGNNDTTGKYWNYFLEKTPIPDVPMCISVYLYLMMLWLWHSSGCLHNFTHTLRQILASHCNIYLLPSSSDCFISVAYNVVTSSPAQSTQW